MVLDKDFDLAIHLWVWDLGGHDTVRSGHLRPSLEQSSFFFL
jgi:hypothetical protein